MEIKTWLGRIGKKMEENKIHDIIEGFMIVILCFMVHKNRLYDYLICFRKRGGGGWRFLSKKITLDLFNLQKTLSNFLRKLRSASILLFSLHFCVCIHFWMFKNISKQENSISFNNTRPSPSHFILWQIIFFHANSRS